MEKSVIELKAQAYDIIAQSHAHASEIEKLNKMLADINKLIAEKIKEEK